MQLGGGPEQNLPGFNYGNLRVVDGAVALSVDAAVEPSATQLVGYFDSYQEVVGSLSKFGNFVNGANILYRPWGPNSNSFAFGAADELLGFRPESSVPALGSGVNAKLWMRE